jgi:SOS-response transcriptional repressor LexA
MHEMTERIYLFIRDFMVRSDGRPPTIRDIGRGVRPERPLSCSLVQHHLNYLEEFGLIERVWIRDTRRRVIQLPGGRFVAPVVPDLVINRESRFTKL